MARRYLPALLLLTVPFLAAPWVLPELAGAPQAAQGTRDPADLIKGKWQATIAGRQYILDLRLEEDELLGKVQLPNRKTVNIEDGMFIIDEFSFTTVEDDVEWEWTGTVSDAGLEGERERFDNDTTETFTAKRQP